MELRPGLCVDDAAIADFATRHGIRRLALFGSVLRDDFSSASDVDILVEFRPGRTPGLIQLAQMELELEAVLRRRSNFAPTKTSAATSATRSLRPRVHSMRPEDTVRLRHLTEAATKAIGYSTGRPRADLNSDEVPDRPPVVTGEATITGWKHWRLTDLASGAIDGPADPRSPLLSTSVRSGDHGRVKQTREAYTSFISWEPPSHLRTECV
jgi:predicted nucleotidyltransferase